MLPKYLIMNTESCYLHSVNILLFTFTLYAVSAKLQMVSEDHLLRGVTVYYKEIASLHV